MFHIYTDTQSIVPAVHSYDYCCETVCLAGSIFTQTDTSGCDNFNGYKID